MSHQKMWDHRNRPDPVQQAQLLDGQRCWKPISEGLPKRSSTRVKRPLHNTIAHLHGVPKTYKSRITLPTVWKEPPG